MHWHFSIFHFFNVTSETHACTHASHSIKCQRSLVMEYTQQGLITGTHTDLKVRVGGKGKETFTSSYHVSTVGRWGGGHRHRPIAVSSPPQQKHGEDQASATMSVPSKPPALFTFSIPCPHPLLGTKPHSHDQIQLRTHTLCRHKAIECFHRVTPQGTKQGTSI